MAVNTTVSLLTRSNILVRYATALLAMLVALAIGRVLGSVLGDLVAYSVVFLAVAFAAWYCGLGPSVVACLLLLAALRLGPSTPIHILRVPPPTSFLGALTLAVVFAALVAMGEIRRGENQALRRAQGDLEERVNERTSELGVANCGLRELTARLMRLQDEERRRIARELHDSVGQSLAALTMNLTTVRADIERLAQTAKTVSDSLSLAQDMSQEVRTVSYLLHPPLLDESGLPSAVRWYVQGFSERSKMQVRLEIPENFGRLPQEMETALFRTVQECLTNIHRHSRSQVATVLLARTPHEICLKVEDCGAGIPVKKLAELNSEGSPGVGLRGMRERMRQLGGSLDLQSNGSGTTVQAHLPLATPSPLAASEGAA